MIYLQCCGFQLQTILLADVANLLSGGKIATLLQAKILQVKMLQFKILQNGNIAR